MMLDKPGLISGLLVLGACARSIPVEAPVTQRPRPDWTSQLALQVDAMRACTELREAPRYVLFLDPLPSGATGVTTIDAFGAVEHCAYLNGEVVRREPTQLSGTDVAEAGGVFFSLGPTMPVVAPGNVLEEVVENEAVVGWLFWPKAQDGSEETGGHDAEG